MPAQPSPGVTAGSGVAARPGRAEAIAHHGEILQGVFPDPDGRLRRGLVTLPWPERRSHATVVLDGDGVVRVRPAWKSKALRAAELTLAALAPDGTGCMLSVSSEVPVGCGFGSSTSDVVATVRAVADAVGVAVDAARVARIAVAAETASDSLMIDDRTVLFAHREGAVLAELGGPLPAVHVLGFRTRDEGTVLTTELPPAAYVSAEVHAFRLLLGALRRAVAQRSADLLGRVATASARLNQRHLPVDGFDALVQLGRRTGAVGLQVAHSGVVAGLLYDSAAPDLADRLAAGRRELRSTSGTSWVFQAGQAPARRGLATPASTADSGPRGRR